LGQAIGQTLLLAVGVALSPIPIIAVILMLVTPQARVNGPAYVVGYLLGLVLLGTVLLLLAAPADASDNGEPATWVDVLMLGLGALLLLLALKQWRGRPQADDEPATPKWMGAIESFTPPKAFGAGVALSSVANPKNLILAVSAVAAIAQTGIEGGEQAIAYALFALLGTVGVAVPVVIFFALGDRAGPILDRLRRWMIDHNAAIMAVLFLVIGAKLVGDAIAGLA
jgi:threonine/homoserine/homoserine lactone efflux protein